MRGFSKAIVVLSQFSILIKKKIYKKKIILICKYTVDTIFKDVTSDQPDRETCTLKCHYL